MRYVVKYVLVLAILMSGFYMARIFRVPDEKGAEHTSNTGTDSGGPGFLNQRGNAPVETSQLPVAALVDVDKLPTRGSIESVRSGERRPTNNLGRSTEERWVESQPKIGRGAPTRRSEGDPLPVTQREKRPGKGTQSRVVDNDSQPFARVAKRSALNTMADEAPWSDQEEVQRGVSGRGSQSRPGWQNRSSDSAYDEPLPNFAERYQPWLDPLDRSGQSEDDKLRRYNSSLADAAPVARDGSSTDDGSPGRHEIVEGDTLASLARRYLGDEQRTMEIYEANRDVLFHPRLLPIGVEIAIPGRTETALVDRDDVFAEHGFSAECEPDSAPRYSADNVDNWRGN